MSPRDILTRYEFPEYSSEYGNISFEYLDEDNTFIISFSCMNADVLSCFQEGSIYINTTPLDFEIHKEKLLKCILSKILEQYKSGVELQLAILSQLRLDFLNITLDPYLEDLSTES